MKDRSGYGTQNAADHTGLPLASVADSGVQLVPGRVPQSAVVPHMEVQVPPMHHSLAHWSSLVQVLPLDAVPLKDFGRQAGTQPE